MPTIPKREILYLAALFHDIAKGRGGDHSDLGAIEATEFALRHHINETERSLLVWLVQHHLLMSQTAQRQDIYDPQTIHHFCSLLPHPDYLDYLYLLTVADICATNPTLWNAWKDSLLKELYYAAKQALVQATLDETALIALRRQKALDLLLADNVSSKDILTLWQYFKGKYFLHESSEVIARHTKAILACKQFPLVLIMPHHSQGGTEILIYMPHRDERFTITTTILNNHQVTIQEAMISRCDNDFDLDTYIILDEKNQAFFDQHQADSIQQALICALADDHQLPTVARRRLTRMQAHFKIKPQISYSVDAQHQHTCLFLVTGDRPGLLARISRIFLNERIHLHSAKIATAGERVEDMFYISNEQGVLLTQEEQERLRVRLQQELLTAN